MRIHEILTLTEGRKTNPLSVTAYHGTSDANIAFRSFAHFGSLRAASHRLLFRMQTARDHHRPEISTYVATVQLTFKNVLRITDDPGYDLECSSIFSKVISRKRLSDQLRAALVVFKSNNPALYNLSETAKLELAGILLEDGIDGFVYKNRAEDKGSDSYIILDSSSVHVDGIAVVTEEELKKIFYKVK